MVSDAVWGDLNQDQKPDLIIAGEWMPIRIFLNQGTSFKEVTNEAGLGKSNGWWNKLLLKDLDLDGDLDIVGGNLGLNTQLKASLNQPASIIAKDFDNNGAIDPIWGIIFKGRIILLQQEMSYLINCLFSKSGFNHTINMRK